METTEIMNFVASFTTGIQITPDDWTAQNKTLEVSEHTTIGEIYAWYKGINTVGAMEVKINQLSRIQSH